MTTILGLGMMYFADFGKFRYSGPVIGLCLAVTLLTCITFTPALLRAFGRSVFWPSIPRVVPEIERRAGGRTGRIWEALAAAIVARPGLILIASVALLLPLAGYGFVRFTPWVGDTTDAVTYDFLSCLSAERPSKRGADLLRKHFPVGESGPLTVLVHRPGSDFESLDGSNRIQQMTKEAFSVPDMKKKEYVAGIRTVRSAIDPLGDYHPHEKVGVLSPRARRRRVLRAHPRTKAIFVTQAPQLRGNVTRLDLVIDYDPFSPRCH